MMMRSIKILFLVLSCIAPSVEADEFIWGVGAHVGHRAYSARQAASALDNLGFNSFRDDVSWGMLERRRGLYDFSTPAAKELGDLLSLPQFHRRSILILGYGNDLYGGGQPTGLAYRAAYANYAASVAGEFGGRVYGFEIWNEWNIGAGKKLPHDRKGSPVEYVELVKEATPRIRANAIGAKIVCGALADKDLRWVDSVVELGLLQYCDGFSVHPYNFSEGARGTPIFVAAWLDRLDLKLRGAAGRSFPIFVTELGWPNHEDRHGVDEDRSEDYWIQSAFYLLARSYVGGMWWYELRDSGTERAEREHNFGVFRYDWSEKPVGRAMRSLLPLLNRVVRESVRVVQAAGVVSWHADLRGGGRLSAFWTADGVRKSYEINIPASKIIYGGRAVSNDDAAQKFHISGSPLIFLVK